ncbi:MAG TPA: hypothetical protein VMS95_03110, partial [Candidatus Krumholzibacteriaceae bacterium]|nr:hypothetical protein [Candidatus Krumholzibacteriaceae bacterium]
MGELAEKADNYCVEMKEYNSEDLIRLDGQQYQKIWIEASEMREEGYFKRIAEKIQCPIRIIHGKDDSTPAEGVVTPLQAAVTDLKWYVIERCGHS